MDNVQLNFAQKRGSKVVRLVPRRWHAHENFAILKRDYIGRTIELEKASMQLAHLAV